MSTRRGRARNAIRGPQSALTDFLAANNISAHQIRLDYERRVRDAEQQAAQSGSSAAAEVAQDEVHATPEAAALLEVEVEVEAESSAAAKRNKRKQDNAIEKIKQSKKFAKKKKALKGEPGEDDDDDIAWDMYEKAKPLPGQLENCEECDKRFTVTPYSKEGPDGGLLCTKCSKAQEAGKKKTASNKKGQTQRNRRKMQSELLDGVRPQGAKSLQELCILKVAENINDVDEFGDLPPKLLDRLARILSKRRLLTSRTLDLFLRPGLEDVSIYDCGRLEKGDFIKILASTPKLKNLLLENAGQVKDNVIDYLIEKNHSLESLKLEAANLVTDEKWRELFDKKGRQLRELKLTWTGESLDDETVVHLVDGCPNLKYLKLKRCNRLTDATLAKLGEFKNLEHLHLRGADGFTNPVALTQLIADIGPNLRSLTLDAFNSANDSLLTAIHTHCCHLQKLRLTVNEQFTDPGLAALFHDWANPALVSLNLASVRSSEEPDEVDKAAAAGMEQDEPMDQPLYGVGPLAFMALLHHSGRRLERLNLFADRYIGHSAMLEGFVNPVAGTKGSTDDTNGTLNRRKSKAVSSSALPGVYPYLADVDFSFVGGVDTTVVQGIFRCAPRLLKLAVFGCFGVLGPVVPTGVVLLGVPNAQDTLYMEGPGGGMVDGSGVVRETGRDVVMTG